jgi:hypothetical protein
MEEDIQYLLKQERLDKRVLGRLENAVDIAQERIDYELASDKELRYALEIVESFLRRKKRVCYGGTAMNALLPAGKKFYSEKDLPDYDFFTPKLEADVEELVNDLQRAGFQDVFHRVGMHEGTKKILVNYIAVADISEMEYDIYEIVFKRSVNIKGIHYTDADILRMMMYLEMSHPKGEVSRWPKVYERVLLMNDAFPYEHCSDEDFVEKEVSMTLRKVLYNYILEKKRTLASGPLYDIYNESVEATKPVKWELGTGGVMMFLSPNPREDALAIRELLGYKGIRIDYLKEKGELVPARVMVKLFKQPIAQIIQETACHSYYIVKSTENKDVRIASMDTLITLYLSLSIFTDDEKKFLHFPLDCYVGRYIQVSKRIRRAPKIKQFQPFALDCQGYQKGYPTLLREKVARISREKEAAKLRKLLKKETFKNKATEKTKVKKAETKTRRNRA